MHDDGDHELLAQYVHRQSEEAFALLVARHVNLVHSVALRHVVDSHQAQDITQVVFLLLAKKAGSLSPKTILSGWLYRTAQLTASNYLRMEKRRQRREQEVHMQSLVNESEPEVWAEMAPVLDVAMARLGDRERNAVILRFFEGKSLKEVGAALGASEDAAQKNVERALTKLRGFFTKRGVVLSAASLASVLSVNSVQAAPVGLAQSITAAGLTKGAALGGTATLLMKSTLKIMTWLKVKTVAKVAALAVLVAGTATVAVHAGDYIKRGRFYLFRGEYDHAIANFDQALRLDPQSAPAYFSRGRANKLEGNYEKALRDYTETIENNPQAVAAYVNRGQIYNLEGDHDRAIADFNRAIQLDSERPIPYLDRGVAEVAKGEYDQAIADFESAIKIDPNFSPAYNNLAWQFATCPVTAIRDGRKAVKYATQACELSQWDNVRQISTLAAAYAEAGDFDSAVKWENKILQTSNLAPKEAAIAKERLALYQVHRPYHREPNAQSVQTPANQ
jgi:RNA polymerase sigma factor (sigma-70 family)